MAQPVTLPKTGAEMTEGTIVKWRKSPGDPVRQGEIIVEVETDKAVVEVESPHAGVLTRILHPEGKTVAANEIIAMIGSAGEAVSAAPAAAAPPPPVTPAPPPAMTSSLPPPPVESPFAERRPSRVDQMTVLAKAVPQLDAGERPGEPPAPPTRRQQDAETRLSPGERIPASPLARRMAAERRIDLGGLYPGSGPNGRIVRQDVESAGASVVTTPASAALPAPASGEAVKPAAVPSAAPRRTSFVPGVERREAATRLQKTVARRMVRSVTEQPQFVLTIDADAEELMRLRPRLIPPGGDGKPVTVTAILVKMFAMALREHPHLNARYEEDTFVFRPGIDLCVAVDTDRGLLTPVLAHADQRSLAEIHTELGLLAEGARLNRLPPEALAGGSATISNLGMFGVDRFTALINPPEAMILSVGRLREEPVVKDGQIAPGKRMSFSLSVDHRVTDGANAARFFRTFREYVENPWKLML